MQKEIDILEDLVAHTRDSINGYYEAAEMVDDDHPILADLFRERAMGRTRLLRLLSERLATLDVSNDALRTDGTISGSLHQHFMHFRSLFQDDSKAALAEVEKGESFLKKTYEEALKDSSDELLMILQECLTTIRQDEESIEAIRRAA